MKIAMDVMGGDKAPDEIIKGAILAAEKFSDMEFILVGYEDVLSTYQLPANVTCRYCMQMMAMDESVEALRQKRDSSIWVATELVKKGEADAVISAGSTGAQMASALLLLGRIRGISRPAIGFMMPTMAGMRLILDGGANADVDAEQLYQFAAMGEVYMKSVYHVESPRIGLLSNGTEAHKGSATVCAAHEMIAAGPFRFIGNLEGRDIPFGEYDVLVCDGFTGNVVLKLSEGLSKMILALIKEALTSNLRSKIGAALVLPSMQEMKQKMDYKEHGGAPLLGVRGLSIVCHGSSDARAIYNAVIRARECYENDFVGKLSQMSLPAPAQPGAEK